MDFREVSHEIYIFFQIYRFSVLCSCYVLDFIKCYISLFNFYIFCLTYPVYPLPVFLPVYPPPPPPRFPPCFAPPQFTPQPICQFTTAAIRPPHPHLPYPPLPCLWGVYFYNLGERGFMIYTSPVYPSSFTPPPPHSSTLPPFAERGREKRGEGGTPV